MTGVAAFRYSAEHGGWFWETAVPNPHPLGRLDQQLSESGYHPRHRGAQRAARRAMKRAAKQIARWEPPSTMTMELSP